MRRSLSTFDKKKIDVAELQPLWYKNVMNCDWNNCPDVERHPSIFSGAWVFKGSRVPVKALFDNIEDGASIDDFLEWFPGVTRHQVESVLEHAAATLLVEIPA